MLLLLWIGGRGDEDGGLGRSIEGSEAQNRQESRATEVEEKQEDECEIG